MSIQNRIFKEERYWELISGPWTKAEEWLMDQHIEDFKRSGIDCTTEPGKDDEIFVYRCAKGYVNLHDKQRYQSEVNHYSECAGIRHKRHKISEFRKIQKEIQQSLCTK